MLWIVGLGIGVLVATAAVDNNQVPKTGFSCDGRTTGYYADVESGCQVYHMCDGLGRQFSYTCPNATLFQQRMLICDHWYMVNCSKSVDDYTANLRIGQKMPFVDDSEVNPYHRTPRPDLLSHPSQSEYDIIYRTGRAQLGTNLNLVGAESDKNRTTSTTDEPAYSLPSHWSTEYSQQGTTSKSKITLNGKKNFDGSTIKGKPIVPVSTGLPKNVELTTVPIPYRLSTSTSPGTTISVNFKSEFKATTPVYPKTVDITSEEPAEVGVLPPGANSTDLTLSPTKNDIPVNFKSEFKATTPVYPKTVDITSEEPAEAGVLPPLNGTANELQAVEVPSLSLEFQAPAEDVNFNPANRSKAEPTLPSKFYQPPKFEPDFTEEEKRSEEGRQGGFKALDNNEWENLRKKFLIPDYEFPLESVSRPSYDSVLSSFQASDVPSKKK